MKISGFAKESGHSVVYCQMHLSLLSRHPACENVRDGRMTGLVKLQRGASDERRCQLRAESNIFGPELRSLALD